MERRVWVPPILEEPHPSISTSAIGAEHYWPSILTVARLGLTVEQVAAFKWASLDFEGKVLSLPFHFPKLVNDDPKIYRWNLTDADCAAFLLLADRRGAPPPAPVFPVRHGSKQPFDYQNLHNGVKRMCYAQGLKRMMNYTQLTVGYQAALGALAPRPLILKPPHGMAFMRDGSWMVPKGGDS